MKCNIFVLFVISVLRLNFFKSPGMAVMRAKSGTTKKGLRVIADDKECLPPPHFRSA